MFSECPEGSEELNDFVNLPSISVSALKSNARKSEPMFRLAFVNFRCFLPTELWSAPLVPAEGNAEGLSDVHPDAVHSGDVDRLTGQLSLPSEQVGLE